MLRPPICTRLNFSFRFSKKLDKCCTILANKMSEFVVDASTTTKTIVDESAGGVDTSCQHQALNRTDCNHDNHEQQRPEYRWKKARKVAVMLSFSGKDYIGMQRNVGFKTIEGELLTAFSKSGFIDPEWVDNPQKAFFQRASRTDKGVSALKMIISLKLIEEDGLIPKVNECLPSDIRLQSVVRVTKNFNCKSAADARTYLYLTPSFAFSPATDIVSEDWRCQPDTVKHVNEVLQCFKGSHYFHNYTSGKLPLEPSSRRHIYKFECSQPFVKQGREWCLITIKGQSFMLHQIRKMIGMTMAVVRGHTDLSKLEETWGTDRIDIPRAPGLGLMLEEIHYDRYNTRYGSDGIHSPLSWEKEQDEVDRFKEDYVFSDIVETEISTKSMFEWMTVLPMHTFKPRHFESDGAERGALEKAAAKVRRQSGEEVVEDHSIVVEDED